jgi:hypothetical protein
MADGWRIRHFRETVVVVSPLVAEHVATRRHKARILGLFGTVEIDPEYDYKAERSRG